jgi:hypothetical protein
MTSISNEAVSGRATVITSESPVRAPLLGGIPWTTPGAPAVGSIPLGFAQQVVTVPHALVDSAGGKQNRQ